MSNKKLLVLWIAIAVLAVGLAWFAFSGNKVVIVDKQGNQLGAISSVYDVGPELGINGLQTYVASGSFVNATTTFISVLNPSPATATINFVRLVNTGVSTSTYSFNCGVNTYANGIPVLDVLSAGIIATSTNFGTITNDTATSTSGVLYAGGSVRGMPISPNSYFICRATHTSSDIPAQTADGDANGIVGNSNTFDGTYKVRFVR